MTDNTAAMIDYLLVRYKDSDATARLNCLKWLQRAEDSVWAFHDWWFKQQKVTVAISAMDTIPAAPCNNVLRVQKASQAPLDYVSPKTFDMICRPDTSTGTPLVYTVGPLDSTTKTPVISVYPTPTGSTNYSVTKEIGPATLTDASNTSSNIPVAYRQAIVTIAEAMMMKHEGQIEASQLSNEIEKNPTIVAMLQEDKRHPKVMR